MRREYDYKMLLRAWHMENSFSNCNLYPFVDGLSKGNMGICLSSPRFLKKRKQSVYIKLE